MDWRLSPERRAEMVKECQADRRIWLQVRTIADGKIRDLDERIEAFGEVSDGAQRP
jgi:hypothetical protein